MFPNIAERACVQKLDISGIDIPDAGFRDLVKFLPGLTSLTLKGDQSPPIITLTGLTNLTMLNLAGYSSRFPRALLLSLAGYFSPLSLFRSLCCFCDLFACVVRLLTSSAASRQRVKDADIVTLLKRLPSLTSLGLFNCQSVATDDF